MKKILLFTFATSCIATSFAQLDTIKNNNFDTWTSNEPTNWGSSNTAYSALSVTGSATKATGADMLGANTLVLTTQASGPNILPGVVVSNGTFTVSGTNPVVKGGLPYRMRPTALTYVAKYNSGGGSDAPLVQVVLTRWIPARAASGGNPAVPAHRDTLGISRSTAAGATYAKETLNISYSQTPVGGNPTTITKYSGGSATPDSVQILIASSGLTGGVANSTLFIDSLAFVYNCDMDPNITTSGSLAILLPDEADTLTAVAGQPFSLTLTNYIPKTVTMLVPFAGTTLPLTTTVDSVQMNSNCLSGSAANFISIDPNPLGDKTGGNSISCITLSGTIPTTPANATYNLILTPIMWGTSSVAPLANFPSPQTNTFTIKVGNGSPALTATDNVKWRTMMYNGQNRVYNVYVPSIYDGSTAVPLVFNIHGWTGSSTKQMDFGDFRSIADTANFIIVQPQALGTVPSWDLTGTSDTDFLMALLDSIESEYNIDTDRIYSTGFSQGGVMSYRFACFHSTRIAAVAPVAGGMTNTVVATCAPTHYMPVLITHGTTDQLASYTGSATSPSVASVINYWVGLNQCNTTAIMTPLTDQTTADNSTVEHYLYDGGMSGSTVEHYKVLSGGHEWPVLTPTKNNYGLGNRNLDFNLSKEIWRFFSKYQKSALGTYVSIDEVQADENTVTVSPNPSNGMFTLNVKDHKNAKVKITDLLGKVVYESTLKSELTTIDLRSVGEGIYIYSVQTPSGTSDSGKIIVQ